MKRECIKNVNKMVRRVGVWLVAAVFVFLLSATAANAATTAKVAENSIRRYSDVGFLIYTVGVEGNYSTDGSEIKYSTTKPLMQTHYPFWSYKDRSSEWTYQGVALGIVKGYATFEYGIILKVIGIPLESHDEVVSAYAYR